MNKKGYEPFIDFLKGICILCVLFLHTMPKLEYFGVCLWAQMAVPIFLMIQAFHVFKKEPRDVKYPSLKKMLKRIIIPFVLIQVFAVAITFLKGYQGGVLQLAKSIIANGGLGPGSYYPWVYLQMAIALPLAVRFLIRRNLLKNNVINCKWGGVLLLICTLQEIAASLLHCPDAIWRLWFGRYIMLIWFGYDIATNGIGMNKWRWITSIMSIVAILVFTYLKPDTEPIFFNGGWDIHRWICYPYAAYLLVWILYKIYVTLKPCISRIVIVLGKASYEIFLTQMVLTTINYAAFLHLKSGYCVIGTNVVVSWILCIFVGLSWNRRTRTENRKDK